MYINIYIHYIYTLHNPPPSHKTFDSISSITELYYLANSCSAESVADKHHIKTGLLLFLSKFKIALFVTSGGSLPPPPPPPSPSKAFLVLLKDTDRIRIRTVYNSIMSYFG